MIDADIGIFHRRRGFGGVAKLPPWPVRIAAHQEANEIAHILFRPAEPVLEGHEVGTDILGGAGDELQYFRQAAKHRHLLGARRAGLGLATAAATKPLQERHHPALLTVHRELAKPRQADDFLGGGSTDHRIALAAPSFDVGEHRHEMLLEEHHARHENIGFCDVGAGAFESVRILNEFGCCMDRDPKARQFPQESWHRTLQRTRQMVVHRQDHKVERRRVSDRSAL